MRHRRPADDARLEGACAGAGGPRVGGGAPAGFTPAGRGAGTAPLRKACDDKAAELLARRPHFRAQLSAKLAARGYPDDEIAAALDRLERKGYLDDRRTAAEFVERRLARGPLGRRRLAAELARRGAPPEAVTGALDLLPADDRAAARAAAARWRGRGGPAALARHLDRLGFGGAAIREAVEEAGDRADGETPYPDSE